jgi:L-ascorbate metabolism protein UlaG (beta-lactamase superfamily)
MRPPASDHFNGKTFHQPGSHPERLFRDFLRWRFTSRPTQWPKSVAVATQAPPPAPRGNEVVATWLGHATYLVQTTSGNFLFDPVFSNRVSPFTWIGPHRVHPVPIPLSALPEINAVCLSHDHYDHCDSASLRQLAERFRPTFIAPLRHHDLLSRVGAQDIVELDWWETTRLRSGAEITLTPTKHWSNRFGTPRNHRLWGGFYVRVGSPRRTIWFVGDSGYDRDLFHQVRSRGGAPDLALVPIGAYEPRWFMAPMHMNPAEAVQLHIDSGARLSLAMHWGTFQLTDESRDAPLAALAEAKLTGGIPPDAFRVLAPGESIVA